jgi:general secretion pathway protein H
VLVIIGLVMALAPPLFHAAVPSVRLKATARDLVASLRLARDLAVSRNTTSELVVDLRQRRYRVTGVARERQLPADVSVTFFPAGGGRDPLAGPVVRFFQDGTSSGGAFRLVTGDNAYLLEVDRLRGRVTLRAAEGGRS